MNFKIFNELCKFILFTSKKYNIDSSHDITHSMDVLHYAHNIYNKEVYINPGIKSHENIIYLASTLHDMCDNKYMKADEGLHNMEIFMKDKIQINDNCQIACAGKIFIGNNVLIASKVFITDHDHDYKDEGAPAQWALCADNVKIGDNCWIGNGVSILKGVVIGRNSIIGAGSVVTKSFPESSIIAGVPAKNITSFSPKL